MITIIYNQNGYEIYINEIYSGLIKGDSHKYYKPDKEIGIFNKEELIMVLHNVIEVKKI